MLTAVRVITKCYAGLSTQVLRLTCGRARSIFQFMDWPSRRISLFQIFAVATAFGIFSGLQAYNYVTLFTDGSAVPYPARAEHHLLVRVGGARPRHAVDGATLSLRPPYVEARRGDAPAAASSSSRSRTRC